MGALLEPCWSPAGLCSAGGAAATPPPPHRPQLWPCLGQLCSQLRSVHLPACLGTLEDGRTAACVVRGLGLKRGTQGWDGHRTPCQEQPDPGLLLAGSSRHILSRPREPLCAWLSPTSPQELPQGWPGPPPPGCGHPAPAAGSISLEPADF